MPSVNDSAEKSLPTQDKKTPGRRLALFSRSAACAAVPSVSPPVAQARRIIARAEEDVNRSYSQYHVNMWIVMEEVRA
jgi:hypothetical protein